MLVTAIYLQAQKARVSGTVFDTESGKAVPGTSVHIGSDSTLSNKDGYFELDGVPAGKTNITFKTAGFDSQTSSVDIVAPATKLGAFGIKHVSVYNAENTGISEVNLSTLDFEDENKGQNITGLLHSTSDVFVSTAGYTLSDAYFRIRGYNSENSSIYMSGIQVNNPESGRPSWSEWGGLNDATRNKEIINGLGAARFSFGDVGGTTNIITRASMQRKQNKLTYSLSDKSYTNRIMYTYSSGLLKNNWAFTLSGSRRWGNESYVKGVFYDAWSYFASAEKKLNDNNSLSLTVFGAPTKRGMQAAATKECFDLTGTHYYNPNWGMQDGEERNARVKNIHAPMAIFNHFWKVNPKINVTNSLGFTYEKNSTSALNWYNAPDPRPDYYRYLPSWLTNADLTVTPDQAVVDALTNAWKTDINTQQINWDKLYQVNYLANATGAQANYVLEDRHNDHSQISLNSLMNFQKSEHVLITGGLELSKYTGYHYKTIQDMLGGNYWVDIDQYAITDFPSNPDAAQNDLNHPNRVVTAGKRYGYDYNINDNSGLLWGQSEFSYNKIECFAAVDVSYTSFWRQGNMRNGREPLNSFGKSASSNFLNYGIKGGATYKINGHNYIIGNAGYITRAPFAENAFVNPDIKNTLVNNLTSEKILSGDISYVFKTPRINARLAAYETVINGGSRVITYYDDNYGTFVNTTMVGIGTTMQGFEFGTEVKATSTLSLTGVAAIGNYRYTSRPTATVSLENQAQPDISETVYEKNFYVAGTPQDAYSFGVKYAHPKMWYFNANINYFDKMYLDFNPERRTETAIAGLSYGDTLINAITRQEKLKSGITVDGSIGKSFYYKKYFFNITFSVNNILDNKDLITNGYEQMRYDYTSDNLNKFLPKYFYGMGRTYFLMVSVRI